MKPGDIIRATDDVNARVKRLEEYTETLEHLFPALSGDLLDYLSIPGQDSLALGYFLECCQREFLALDVGSPLETSAFYLAAHPQVRQVVCAGPDRKLAEIAADADTNPEPLQELRAREVAQAALAEFPSEQKKITYQKETEIPTLKPDGAWIVAFVGGDKTREGIRDGLSALFAKNPQAVAVVAGCRRENGPFVQAGIAEFLEGTPEECHFCLLGDLGPGLAAVGLGVLYLETRAMEMEEVLDRLGRTASRALDPLSLLAQREDLVATVNRLRRDLEEATGQGKRAAQKAQREMKQRNYDLQQRNSDLKKKIVNLRQNNSHLKRRNSQMVAHYASRRYRLADVLVGSVRRLLTSGRQLARRNKPDRA